MINFKVRKDDQVMVITGKEKGKTGKVTRVNPEKATLLVEKLNIVKRHQKPSQKFKNGGIIEKEAPMAISNVMLLCVKCKGPVRVGRKLLDDGKKVRVCKKCGEVLDK
ncbi:MAG: 50S ribosomal protein L24 [Deltaproteobacteria bacterium RIFCSPLOWO2_02_FULL_53_8]|nr:MAG: 50S ribosomal protein L24 [Deltaproteobacteria bacterium RIFCSPLOWO2_02_FULL_53_8]